MPERTFRLPVSRLRFVPAVTVAVTAAVLMTAGRFGVFGGQLPSEAGFRYGFTARSPVTGGWARVLTSQLLTRDKFMAVSIAVSLLVMLGVYEAIAGSRRAVVVAAVTALAGPLFVAAGLGALSALGDGFAARTLSTLDYGASTITAGGGGALIAVLGDRRLRWAAVVFVVGGLVVHHQLADWEHLCSFPVGYALGRRLGLPARAACSPTRTGRGRRLSRAGAIAAVAALAGSVASPLIVSTASAVPAAQRSPARLVATDYPAPSVGTRQAVLVLLPAGYDHSPARYPVVEFLHGRPGRPQDAFVYGDLWTAAAAPGVQPFIAVVPDGRGPVVADGDFADTTRQRLGAAMSDDLQAWVDRTFRTTGWWGVAGVSAGGYGAAYLASRRRGAYRAVCSMSGYFTARGPAFAGQPTAVVRSDSPIDHPSRYGPPTLLITSARDLAGLAETRSYRQALEAAGQPVVERVGAGDHSWASWRREIPGCLRFALTGRADPGAAHPGLAPPGAGRA